jgi:hypothetical protein
MVKRFILLFAFLLAGCGSVAEHTPVPTRPIIRVAATPAVFPMVDALQICSGALADTALVVDEVPGGGVDPDRYDLTIRFAYPQESTEEAVLLVWDHVVLVVHSSNPIDSLSIAQWQAVFTGRVRNWKSVGGKQGPIQVWVGTKGDEVRQAVDARLLGDAVVSPLAKIAPSPQAMLDAVRDDPGAVGYLVHSWRSDQVKTFDLGIELPVLAYSSTTNVPVAARDLLICLQGESVQEFLGLWYTPIQEE